MGSYNSTQVSTLHDVLTGKNTPAPELTQHLRAEPGEQLLSSSLDPTRWILSATKDFQVFHARSPDRKQRVDWKTPKDFRQAQFYWMNDNRHWLALQENPKTGKYTRALVGDRLTPGTLQEIVLPEKSPFNQINHSIGCTVSPQRILALPGRFYQYHHPKPITPVLYEISIHGKNVSVKKHPVVLPKGAGLREVAISPDGKRIAWRLREIVHAPFSQLQPVHLSASWKEIAWRKSTARAINSLWLSDGVGKQMREIGYVDVPLRESDIHPAVSEGIWLTGSDEPRGLEWLPGNNYLSLWVRDEMYRFPVQKPFPSRFATYESEP